MRAMNGFIKASWKPVNTLQETLEKLFVAPMQRKKSCLYYSSHAAVEKPLNTTRRGFWEIRENSKIHLLEITIDGHRYLKK
jgi:hypothetical protein